MKIRKKVRFTGLGEPESIGSLLWYVRPSSSDGSSEKQGTEEQAFGLARELSPFGSKARGLDEFDAEQEAPKARRPRCRSIAELVGQPLGLGSELGSKPCLFPFDVEEATNDGKYCPGSGNFGFSKARGIFEEG